MAKFLSEAEYEVIWNMMVDKGFPMFHLTAFKVDESGQVKFKMITGLNSETDYVYLLEITEILQKKLQEMCAGIAEGTKYPEPEKDDIGTPRGNC